MTDETPTCNCPARFVVADRMVQHADWCEIGPHWRAPDTQVAPSPPPPDTTFIAGATMETDFAEALRAVREDKRDCFLAWQTADGVRVCSLGSAAFLLEVADAAMDSAERTA